MRPLGAQEARRPFGSFPQHRWEKQGDLKAKTGRSSRLLDPSVASHRGVGGQSEATTRVRESGGTGEYRGPQGSGKLLASRPVFT